MISSLAHDLPKKLRFCVSLLRRRLIHVNLQLLYTCNYRCGICDFWKPQWKNQPRLSAAQVGIIAGKLAKIGPQIVSIGGGEPMIHDELPEIVGLLSKQHFPVMITNGSLVTEELARELWRKGMVEISVSLDYADPARHDTQRGHPGAYAAGVKALRILHATRTHPEQRVNLISVMLDDNLDDIEALIGLSEELGISYLMTLYSHSRGDKAVRPPPAEVSRRLLELKKQHRHFVALRGYLGRFTEAMETGGIGPCYAGRNLCNIDSTGQLGLCIDRLSAPVGNILTDDIFELERRLLDQHLNNRCRDCWTSCRGSIESVLYGKRKLGSLLDYYQMTRPIPLGKNF